MYLCKTTNVYLCICAFVELYAGVFAYWAFLCVHSFVYWCITLLLYILMYCLMSWFVYRLIYLLINLYVRLCIYVFMCGCIYVLMYLCKTTNVYLCIYVILVLYNCCFVFLWFCVNPLSSSIPFVIDGYINMLHIPCSHGTDGQDAILGLHAGLSHRAMRHKRVIVARLVI